MGYPGVESTQRPVLHTSAENPSAASHQRNHNKVQIKSRKLCQELAALGQVALSSVVPGRAAFPLGGTAASPLPTKKEQQDKQAQEKQGNEKYSYKYVKHDFQHVALCCSLG